MLRLSFVIEAVDKATAVARKVNDQVARMTYPMRRLQNHMEHLGRQAGLAKLGSAFDGVTAKVRGLLDNMRSVRAGVFAISLAATGAIYPLLHVIDKTSAINDTAAMLGLSARELQRVSFALTLDGSSMEDAATSLKFLQRNAVEAVTGNQDLAMWFRRAGISADFLKKNLKDPKALLYAVSDGLKKQEVPAKRLDILQNLLGRSSGRLAQTLARGSDELKHLGDEAEELGSVLDENTVVAMDDAGDSLTKMNRALYGVFAQITAAALPVVQEITSSVIGWVKANKKLIETKATEFFKKFLDNLPKIVQGISDTVDAIVEIGSAVNKVVQFFGGWDNVIQIVAAVMIGKLAISLLSTTVAILRLGAAFLATPFGWFAIAIAGLAAGAYFLMKNWEPVRKFFTDLWDGIVDAFSVALTPIFETIDKTIDAVRSILPGGSTPGRALGAGLNWANGSTAQTMRGPVGTTNVGGVIRMQIDDNRRLRVNEVRSSNNDVPLEVRYGPVIGLAS